MHIPRQILGLSPPSSRNITFKPLSLEWLVIPLVLEILHAILLQRLSMLGEVCKLFAEVLTLLRSDLGGLFASD
jgi:hypothetical protein